MASQLLAQFHTGQTGEAMFCIVESAERLTSAHKPFVSLVVCDRSARRRAVRWDATPSARQSLVPGVVVHAQVEAKPPYRRPEASEPEFIIHQFEIIPHAPAAEYMPDGRSGAEAEEDWRRFSRLAKSVEQPDLKRLLHHLFSDKDFRTAFRSAPAAQHRHHAYPGGLLEHSVEVAELAAESARRLGGLDVDVLVTGALLHDAGKTREINQDGVGYLYTEPGNLMGHVFLGAEMVDRAAHALGNVDPGVVGRVKHLILSHHGRKEWGAPVEPATPEALLLHNCDQISAQAFYCRDAARANEAEAPVWVPALERRIFVTPGSPGKNGAGSGPMAGDEAGDTPWREEEARPEIRIVAGGLSEQAEPPQMAAFPIYGCIAAGSAIRTEQNLEGYLALPLAGRGDAGDFLLRVTGDSMRDAHVLDGDIVRVCPCAADAREGDIVAALVNGDATVKRLHRQGGSILLRAENPAYPDIAVGPSDDFSIQGVVVGLVREHMA